MNMPQRIKLNSIKDIELSWLKKIYGRPDVILLLLSISLFLFWPELDLVLANQFYDAQQGAFIGMQSDFLYVVYKVFAFIQIPMILVILGGMLYCWVKQKKKLKTKFVFLFCCLVLGPGILVNIILKDNSIGRARPRQVDSFGGQAPFTSPFEYSGHCQKNCSFTSGHASIGFILIALAWTSRRREYFIGGIALGAFLGIMRMAQGAHFFSDVLFAFWVVYMATLALTHFFQLRISESEAAKEA